MACMISISIAEKKTQQLVRLSALSYWLFCMQNAQIIKEFGKQLPEISWYEIEMSSMKINNVTLYTNQNGMQYTT